MTCTLKFRLQDKLLLYFSVTLYIQYVFKNYSSFL